MTFEEIWVVYGSDIVAVFLAFLSALFAFLARRRITKVSKSVDQVSANQIQANAVLSAVEQKISSGGISNGKADESAQSSSGFPEVQCDGVACEVREFEASDGARRNLSVTNLRQNYEIQVSVSLKGVKAVVSVKALDLVDGHELTKEELKDLLETMNEFAEV